MVAWRFATCAEGEKDGFTLPADGGEIRRNFSHPGCKCRFSGQLPKTQSAKCKVQNECICFANDLNKILWGPHKSEWLLWGEEKPGYSRNFPLAENGALYRELRRSDTIVLRFAFIVLRFYRSTER